MGATLSWDVDKTYSDTKCKITLTLYVTSTSGSWNGNAQSGYIKINGVKHSFTHAFSSNTKTKLASASETVNRPASASDLSVSLAAAYATGVSAGTITKTGTVSVANLASYTVGFSVNGGSGASSQTKTVYYGKTTTFPSPSVTKTGYHHNSKYGTTTTGGTLYSFGGTTPAITSGRTYYVNWIANTYSVAYFKNNVNASGTMSNSSHTYGVSKALNINAYTLSGYSFEGWAETSEGSAIYSDGVKVSNLTSTNGGTKNLYAKWTANEYIATFNANGGRFSSPDAATTTTRTETFNSTTSSPSLEERTGYEFIGWSPTLPAIWTETSNKTYTAQWRQTVNAPTVTKLIATRSELNSTSDNLHIQLNGNTGFYEDPNTSEITYPSSITCKIVYGQNDTVLATLTATVDSTNHTYSLDYTSSGTNFLKNMAYTIKVLVTANYPSLTDISGVIEKQTFISKDLPVIQIPYETSGRTEILDKAITFGRALRINDGSTNYRNVTIQNQGITTRYLGLTPDSGSPENIALSGNTGIIKTAHGSYWGIPGTTNTIALSTSAYALETAGRLTSSAGMLTFSVPLNRVFTNGSYITDLTCEFIARASNNNGTGLYIMKGASASTSDRALFDFKQDFSYYDAANNSHTIGLVGNADWSSNVFLEGNCFIQFVFDFGTDAFSGNSTNRGYINNNACIVSIFNLNVTITTPSS